MNYLRRNSNLKNIIIIFFLAIIIRVIAAVLFGGFTNPEAWEYEDIARNLYQGRGFLINFIGEDYYGYSTPLYPAFAALIYRLFLPEAGLVITGQILFSSLLCGLIYLLAFKVFGRKTAVLAALISALHPGLIIYSSIKLHALTLDAFFITLTVYSFLLLLEEISFKRAIFAGISCGLCVLTRSTIAPFLILGLGLVIRANRPHFKKALILSMVTVITSAVIIGSWSYRNYLVFRRFIPITTVSAEVFWRGNNINATGTSFTREGKKVLEADKDFYENLKELNELERYDLFKTEAVNFIRKNPVRFIKLTLKKFYYFWWFSPDSGMLYPKNLFRGYKYAYFILVMLALPAFAFNRTRAVNLLILGLVVISLTQSLFYIEGRHRLAIEPLVFIFSSSMLGKAKFK